MANPVSSRAPSASSDVGPSPEARLGAPEPARKQSFVRGMLRAIRPKQWAKNVLVGAAPAAAGVLDEASTIVNTAAAFAAFCLVASALYLHNDISDREADRRHPTKRNRPIASGVISAPAAATAAVVLLLGGLATALAVRWELALVVALYAVMTVSYSAWLKHIAVIDVAVVASGFVFRAVGGGVAVDVPISQWFLIVASFGSLFMVAGKRHAEYLALDEDRALARETLGTYSLAYLRYVWMMASAVAIAGYCLWAFEQADIRLERASLWYELSVVPFVLAILRYALLLDGGHGSEPEEIVLGDRTLQVLGVVWAAVFGIGIYLGR